MSDDKPARKEIFTSRDAALRVDIGQDCSGQENKLKEEPDSGILANPEDGPPDDKKAFFGHPLTAATSAINGDDTQALRAALQHEYMNFSTNYGDDIKEKLFSLCDVNRDGKSFRNRDLFPMEVVDMILENNENRSYCVDTSELFRQETEKFFPAGNQEELNGNLRLSVNTVCIPNPTCDTFQAISDSSGTSQHCNSSTVYNVANTISNNLKDNCNNIQRDTVCVAVSSASNLKSSLGTRIRAPIQKVSEQVLINPLPPASRHVPITPNCHSQASGLCSNIGLALRSTAISTSATAIAATTSVAVTDVQGITGGETLIRQIPTDVNTIGNNQICNSQVENIRSSLGTTQNPTTEAVQNADLGHTIPVDFPKLYSIAGHLSNPAENVPSSLEKTVNGGANSGSAVAVDRQRQQQQPEAENVLPFIPGKTRPTDLVANSSNNNNSSSNTNNIINSSSSSHHINNNKSSSSSSSNCNNTQSENTTCDRQEILVGRQNHAYDDRTAGGLGVEKSVAALTIPLHESTDLLYETDPTNSDNNNIHDSQVQLDRQQSLILQQQINHHHQHHNQQQLDNSLLDSLHLESVSTTTSPPPLSETATPGLGAINVNGNCHDVTVGVNHATSVEITKTTTTNTTTTTITNSNAITTTTNNNNDNNNTEVLLPTADIVTESRLSKFRDSLSQTACPSLMDDTIAVSSSSSVNKELIEALSAKIRQRMNDNSNTSSPLPSSPPSSSTSSFSSSTTTTTTAATTTTTTTTTIATSTTTSSSSPSPPSITTTTSSTIATSTSPSSPLPLPSDSLSSSISSSVASSSCLLSSSSSSSSSTPALSSVPSSTCSTTLTSTSRNPCSPNSAGVAATSITTTIGNSNNNISLNINNISSNNNNKIIAPTVNVSIDDSHSSNTSNPNNNNNNNNLNNDSYNNHNLHRRNNINEEEKDAGEINNCGSLLTAVIAAASSVSSLESSHHFRVHNGSISGLSDHHPNMVMVDGSLHQHGIDDTQHHNQHHRQQQHQQQQHQQQQQQQQQQQHQQQQQQVSQLYNLDNLDHTSRLHYVKQETFLDEFGGGGSSSSSCADLAAAFDPHRLNSLPPVSSTALITAASTPPGSVDTGGGGGDAGGGGGGVGGNVVNGNTTVVNGGLITNSQGQCLQVLQPVQVQQQQQQHHAAAAHTLQLQQQQQRTAGLNNSYQGNDAYFNNFFGRTTMDGSGQGSPYDNMNRLMMQPPHYFGDQTVYSQTLYGNSLQSPDSGYHECMSPTDVNTNTIRCLNSNVAKTPLSHQIFKEAQSALAPAYGGATTGAGGSEIISEQKPKYLKRRRSQSTVNIKGQIAGAEKLHGSSVVIPKLENDTSGYRYIMETPTSTTQRIEEDRITYLNKGQYYTLLMENTKKEKHIKNITVTTLILVNFREPMSLEKNLIAWELWSDRQHSTKTRILDIDTKNGQGILSNSIEELSHNAVSVKWKPSETPSQVNIAINCLSTDFSNQKGVKGIPLHIQVDTYEGENRYPVHRGYCQVKIFCDKGAERKTRDEERRRTAKVKTENSDSPTHSPPLESENDLYVPNLLGRKRSEEIYHQTCERSEFYTMQDLTTEPQLFNPLGDIDDYRVRKHGIVHYSLNEEERVGNSINNNNDNNNLEENRDGYPPTKVPRRNNFLYCMTYQKVMLYVREQTESTFTALLLRTPTVEGLLRAVEEKYEIPASKVKNTYKRSKKGVLIKMDNNIIQHYAHETTFIIEKCRTADDKGYEIILTEIDP